jgi:hypothetical protein
MGLTYYAQSSAVTVWVVVKCERVGNCGRRGVEDAKVIVRRSFREAERAYVMVFQSQKVGRSGQFG